MKRRFFVVTLVTIIVIGIVGGFLLSPVFAAEAVDIIGCRKIPPEEIKRIAGITDSVNIFALNDGLVRSKLLENRYIEDVTIHKDFFSKIVTIKIEERILSGYVEHSSGSYLYIDEKGRVLEVKSFINDNLPIVAGLQFTEFTLGEPIAATNNASFETLVTLVTLFNKYSMQTEIIKVDVSDELDIHFFINKVDIQFGSVQDADEKIRTLIAIMEKIDFEKQSGFLDIRDINNTPRFKYLT